MGSPWMARERVTALLCVWLFSLLFFSDGYVAAGGVWVEGGGVERTDSGDAGGSEWGCQLRCGW